MRPAKEGSVMETEGVCELRWDSREGCEEQEGGEVGHTLASSSWQWWGLGSADGGEGRKGRAWCVDEPVVHL